MGELVQTVKDQPIGTAAILVVGKAVNFREHLRWFDTRPLFGLRALVMHSKEQPDDLGELLEGFGAEVVIDTDATLDRIYRQLLDGEFDIVKCTSASAVLEFAASAGVDQASDLLAHTVVATLGPAAADAAGRAGMAPAIQLPAGTLATLAEAVAVHFKHATATA